jgi:hypothetical protein
MNDGVVRVLARLLLLLLGRWELDDDLVRLVLRTLLLPLVIVILLLGR